MSGGGMGTGGVYKFIKVINSPVRCLSLEIYVEAILSCSISSSAPDSSTTSGMGIAEAIVETAAGFDGISQSNSCITENAKNNIVDNTICNM